MGWWFVSLFRGCLGGELLREVEERRGCAGKPSAEADRRDRCKDGLTVETTAWETEG
jgi:hypothetical protein